MPDSRRKFEHDSRAGTDRFATVEAHRHVRARPHGRPCGQGPLDAPGWKLMLSLVADGAWTKSAGAYRLSTEPSYTDAIPFARSLIQTAPDRCVWGSDWPQVGFWGPMPNVGTLLDLLADWAPTPTPATRS
jgi:predicted TIM-barrel fold metal-dependent hydrolase